MAKPDVHVVQNEEPIENASTTFDVRKAIERLDTRIKNCINALEFSARWIEKNEGEDALREWAYAVDVYMNMNLEE